MVKRALPTDTTRDRLFAAAERLLLTREYDEVSVRAVCQEARANPAAVHYHFGSKEALVAALLEDRLGPVWAAGLTAADADQASVPEFVDAVIEPFRSLTSDPIGRLHMRLLTRLVLDRGDQVWTTHWFRIESWARLLPDLDEHTARRRWALAFDLILLRFGNPPTAGQPLSPNSIAALRDFVVAGLTA